MVEVLERYRNHNFSYPNSFCWPLGATLHRKLFQCIKHPFSTDQFAKDGVLLIEMGSRPKRDVKLRSDNGDMRWQNLGLLADAPIGSWTFVGHCNYTTGIVLRSALHVMFVSERRTPMRFATGTCTCWVAGLDLPEYQRF
jgi:hypothetical protein